MGDDIWNRSSTPPPLLGDISPASLNLSTRHLGDLPSDPSFAWLLFALVMGIVWLIYITFYNSRVFGYVITKIVNRFVKHGYLKIGSFSLSVLSGTLMFRDVTFIEEDYSVSVQDGWIKFRWWYKYIKREITEDLSHSDPRLSILLNGFELHFYNRSTAYARLERVFSLFPHIFPDACVNDSQNNESREGTTAATSESSWSDEKNYWWRDFIPVIKCDISSGRVVFGNRLLPTTLLISSEDAHMVYTTKLPFSRIDKFRHTVNCRADNFKIILAPSPKYRGIEDEPPRFMGEGFVVLQSNCVDLYYYQDEPGLVPEQPELIELADGRIIVGASTSPAWGVDIKCGKGTDFSYGPWADRQRDHLFNFFFPQDYQPLKVTQKAKPGEQRQFKSFDIRLSVLYDSTIDTLFSKDKVTSAVHMNVKQGSYLEITIPWIIGENGYTTRINGQLFHVDASTSHTYRSLFETETLEFDVTAKYPLIWNESQQWSVNITGCKATVNLIYEHKTFFQDLTSDWASKSKPDILRFIPYSVNFSVILKEYEIVLLSNEHNWIDCSSQHQENAHFAFCGEVFEMSLNLPFFEFLPPVVPIKIWIQGECVNLAMYLPESNTNRNIVIALDNNSKLIKRDGSVSQKEDNDKRWRKKAQKSLGWIDCWTVPIVALSINYSYHPIPPIDLSVSDENFTTPEKEEQLLNPIRPPTAEGDATLTLQKLRPHAFDPTVLPPDVVNVDLEVGSSVVYLYGCLLGNFMHVKENYFGTDQKFTESSGLPNTKISDSHLLDEISEPFDSRLYRPLEVIVSVTMHDIQGYAVKSCGEDDSPCPSAYLEKLVFEMHKTYTETKLQLLLSPLVLSVVDVYPRPVTQQHLSNGFVALSALQVRGHAMFSDEGIHLNDETLEYAWLTEIKLGYLSGRLTTPQLNDIIVCVKTFIFLMEDSENTLHSPSVYRKCHHGHGQLHCIDRTPEQLCPTPDDIKYKMTRFSMEQIDIFLVETSIALNLSIAPVKLTFCNLHGHQTESGLTALINSLKLKQYVLNSAGQESCNEIWLEVGSLILEKVYLDSIRAQSQSLIHERQNAFLCLHDGRSKRLWFLWPSEISQLPIDLIGKCGCRGACAFFSTSQNLSPVFHTVNSMDQQLLVNSNSAVIYSGSTRRSPFDGVINVDTNEAKANNPAELSPVADFELTSKSVNGSVQTLENVLVLPSSAPVRTSPVMPLVQRALSYRETGTRSDNEADPIIAGSNANFVRFVNVNETNASSSVNRPYVQASSVPSLPDTNKSTDSPVRVNKSTSRHSLVTRQPSVIERTISIGRESVASLDIFYPAEDGLLTSKEQLSHLSEAVKIGQNGARQMGSLNSLTIANGENQHNNINQDERESNSVSSTSFISAVSSQEDLALVDLHVQLDKPITESPLLMAAYNSHTTRLQCFNWYKSPTLYNNSPRDSDLINNCSTFYVTDYIPYFEPIYEGFSAIKLIEKECQKENENRGSSFSTDAGNFWNFPQKLHDKYDNDELDGNLFFCEDSVSKTTVVIKVEGDFDIHISPLMLEATQHFMEALTQNLAKMHPATILTQLHSQCVADVQAANQLKKEKYLYLSHLNQLRRANKIGGKLSPDDHVYEETRTAQIQTFFTFKKLNVSVLQASISEELTSFSALENILDVTCVSLFLLSISDFDCKLFSSTQSHKTIQTIEVVDAPAVQRKKSITSKTKKSKLDWDPPEQNPIETSETQEEELMISFDLHRIHTQLRRLKNNGNILKDAVLTVISKEQSKVFFTCDVDFPSVCRGNKMPANQPSCSSKVDFADQTHKFADQLGFIMSECGIECLQLKFTKQIGFRTSMTLDDVKGNTGIFNGAAKSTSESTKPRAARNYGNVTSAENPVERSSALDSSNGDITSIVLELKSFWFNFAAPPHSPKAEKPIYTRLDWHLLSTATPAINSWLNPTNRLVVVMQKLSHEMAHRRVAVIACLMSEASDVPNLHRPIMWKQNVLTPLAKTLREDPSCQLLSVLQRYLNSLSTANVEAILLSDTTPKLETIHKGLVALCRQWKNVLYMPSVVERNIKLQKNQKPFRVSFAVPIRDPAHPEKFSRKLPVEKENLIKHLGVLKENENISSSCVDISPSSEEDSGSDTSDSDGVYPGTDGDTSEGNQLSSKRKRLPCYKPRSSRASVVLPLLAPGQSDSYGRQSAGVSNSNSRMQSSVNKKAGTSKQAGNYDSSSSLNSASFSAASGDGEGINLISPLKSKHAKKRSPSHDLDLYTWMARQQDYAAMASDDICDRIMENTDPRGNTMGSDDTKTSGSQSELHQSSAFSLGPIAAQLADTHVIFYPLLSGLQVPSQVAGSMFSQRFGTNLTIKAVLDLFKIDMVESHFSHGQTAKNGRSFHRASKLHLDQLDSPAFKCEKLVFDCYFKEGQEMEKSKDLADQIVQPTMLIYGGADNFRKHTTITVNLCMNIENICQRVNLPLLRLLHQFSSVYHNAVETQSELKGRKVPENSVDLRFVSHKKANSLSGSENQGDELVGKPLAPDMLSLNNDKASLSTSVHASEVTTPVSHQMPDSGIGVIFRRHTSKFRPSIRKYANLDERVESPDSANLSHAVVDIDGLAETVELRADKIKEKTPRCWKTMYYLMDLYATMPETKTISNRSPMVVPSASDNLKRDGKYEQLKENFDEGDEQPLLTRTSSSERFKSFRKSLVVKERVPLVILGVVKIRRVKLKASLSGLKLEAELSTLQASHSHKEKIRGLSKKWSESSATGHLGKAKVVLLEEVFPNHQTVVKAEVGKCQALFSGYFGKLKEKNSAFINIGSVNVDIPQHPVVLHGMMTRSSKQLSTTLHELRTPRTAMHRHVRPEDVEVNSPRSPRPSLEGSMSAKQFFMPQAEQPKPKLLHPIVVHFTIILDGLTIGASLLPSLTAKYQMDQITSIGVTGSRAKFTVDLPMHRLSFATKVPLSEANLPSSASIDLPELNVSAEYIQPKNNSYGVDHSDPTLVDGAVLRKGNYLSAVAHLGAFEHSLTTDLLNHLVLVQKVFMKEINEVVQKMAGGDKPVRLWSENGGKDSSVSPVQLLYSIQFRLKGIQITATTPTYSAVRLETGCLELQLSNRVKNLSGATGSNRDSAAKLFGKAHVELNLTLGQIVKNPLFEEAESEFQQVAYFKTRIQLRNALQDEMVSNSGTDDKEAVFITLHRPLVYVQPVALDRAVLVWLNYKNAYEYWNEQRSSLNKEVLTATQQVFEKVPPLTQLGSHSISMLFLQLTVDDLGICLPLTPHASMVPVGRPVCDSEHPAACVVTLETTSISACSSGSLVSKGNFQGLCIRFADEFETSLDDWKPDPNDAAIMNLCVVSEGTYEVCSRTISHHSPEVAKWILNVQWQMDGVSIHVDTNIGKHLSAMAQTLTSLAGTQEVVEDEGEGKKKMDQGSFNRKPGDVVDGLPSFVFDNEMDFRKRSRMLEREMNEQARIVNDLKSLGASHTTIEQETRRLQELEAACFNDFRREMLKRLRKQSMKASSFKEKFGLSLRRDKSVAATPTPTPDKEIAGGSNIFLSPASCSPATSPVHGHTRTISLDSATVTFDPDSVNNRDFALGDKWPSADTMEHKLGYVNIPTFSYNVGSATAASVASTPLTATTDSSPLTNNTPSDAETHFTRGSSNSVNEEPTGFTTKPTFKFIHRDENSMPSNILTKQAVAEPNIDFELDVKVFISSGKCVLHTKDFREEREILGERSFSNSTFEFPMSPGHRKKGNNNAARANASTGKLKFANASAPTQAADFTVFLIPGLDVKVSYNSKTEIEDTTSNAQAGFKSAYESRFLPRQKETEMGRKLGMKKASLFAWLTLQGIPEEAVITPHLLDFLEKALEPIPMPVSTEKINQPPQAGPGKVESFVTSTSSAYGSFPVDVVVYLRIQPSTLRFSCLPVSRVECLLRLPSVDLVISTKRAENERDFKTEFSNTKSKGIAELYLTHAAVGGLSVTACLADFFIYVFHPYGGKKSGSSANGKDGNGESTPSTGSSGRRDAFSVQLEFVKVNISRSRKITSSIDNISAGNSWMTPEKCASTGGAVIRFSAICDVGSASFKYDMRRLSEILAFPKAWYRRSIVRRLFLGEQSLTLISSDQEDSCSSVGSPRSLEEASKESVFNISTISLDNTITLSETTTSDKSTFDALLSPSRGYINRTAQSTADRRKLTLDLPDTKHHSRTASAPVSPMSGEATPQLGNTSKFSAVTSPQPPTSKTGSTWETLVLFAVNLSKLNIHMNMGNVMGNTIWTTHGLQSQGRLSIGSTGHKNMIISMGLEGSSFDAKGGIVGGAIELSQVNAQLNIKEDPGLEPDHSVKLKLFALESRLDYMGTTVLMGRVSSLNVTLKDEWSIHSHQTRNDLPTKRPALIFIHGDMAWDQLQIMISRSTTPDLLKMNSKLEEFFAQQFQSSKRMLSSLQPDSHYKSMQRTPTINKKHQSQRKHQNKGLGSVRRSSRNSSSSSKSTEPKKYDDERRHHRHWQNILARASGLKLSALETPLPPHGTILGGSMELHGNNISLACFHGVNFRAKSWALFSLKEPHISFATEAQDIINQDTNCRDTHIVQNLSFNLGHNITEHTRHKNMATVCRISKSFVFPPQFRSMQDWFHYAFVTSEIDGLERDRRDSVSQDRQSQMKHSPKDKEGNHSMEMIFALPSLQLHLKTEHMQQKETPDNSPTMGRKTKPIVECSFITEFEDHIFVAIDAEAFFFLHDLITSYVKEKDRGVPTSASMGKTEKSEPSTSVATDAEKRFVVGDPTEALQKDWRSYECKTWHLEPTVRLMSWAGKRIEPYGVDYILNKLGFSHARITIPKWMQRGAMDPLDKLLAVLMEKTINALKEGGDEKNGETN
ncbi:hypothetical protein CHUAL_008817 [Chamberlinius hualienensis]